MSFKEKVDEHITQMLNEGVLPDSGEIVEMEVGPRLHDMTVPGQQPGPQHSGDEGGPKSAPAATFPWLGKHRAADLFKGASMNKKFPCPPFSNQNRQHPPAMFSGAATEVKENDDIDREAVLNAVLADLSALNDSDE